MHFNFSTDDLMSYFPSYLDDLKNLPDVNGLIIGKADDLIRKHALNEYYKDKMATAIHEAGHIVAMLLLSETPESMYYAYISCKMIPISEDSIIAYSGWHGAVNYNPIYLKKVDQVMENVLNISGMNAEIEFGFSTVNAYLGAAKDLEDATEIAKENTKRIGGVDKSLSWSQQKNEYKAYMKQEENILSLYTKVIIQENYAAIIPFANALYEQGSLTQDKIKEIASRTTLHFNAFNNLKRYITEFYSKPASTYKKKRKHS